MKTLEIKRQVDIRRDSSGRTAKKAGFFSKVSKDFLKYRVLYLMVIPVILYYLLFCYLPMYGAIIAFKDYNPVDGILGSSWVNFKHFKDFFTSFYFVRLLKNTLVISGSGLLFSFPAPILLALLINELRLKRYKSIVQTITYLPHFISLIVICGMIRQFTSADGLFNDIAVFFGGTRSTMLSNAKMFVPIYIISDIWQTVGWGSIIYLAALMGVDQQIYDAAKIDGAGRLRQLFHVTLPGIMPTIIIMLLLRIGNILNVGHEKIILLYSPLVYDSSDVISTYVYRKGLQEYNWSFSTAVGLFNSVINFTLVFSSNRIAKKFNGTSLW